jgi:LysM repeat protein
MAKEPERRPLMSVLIAAFLILFCASAAFLTFLTDGDKKTSTPATVEKTATAAAKETKQTTTPKASPTDTPAATPTSQAIIHVVQTGETLRLIAEKYGVTIQTLVALNDIEDADKIMVGQELVVSVPPDWTPPPTPTP